MTAPIIDNETRQAPGILLILNDVLEETEDEFNRWYEQEHLPERLSITGFNTARRYRALGAQNTYMAVYECQSIDVLSSPPYKERLAHPTDWTKKIMPSFRNMLRSACRETWAIGDGIGSSNNAVVVRCKPIDGKEADARRFIKNRLAETLMQSDCIVRMALWEADAAVTGGTSTEMALRGGRDRYADWVLFIESHDLERVAQALDAAILASDSASTGLLIGGYTRHQLMCHRVAAIQA